jgi:hypothetical protein
MKQFAHKHKRGKHNLFQPFNLKDLAEAIGVGYWSLRLYLKRNKISYSDLGLLSLKELNAFINSLKDKRPLNTNCPRAKPSNKEVKKPEEFDDLPF